MVRTLLLLVMACGLQLSAVQAITCYDNTNTSATIQQINATHSSLLADMKSGFTSCFWGRIMGYAEIADRRVSFEGMCKSAVKNSGSIRASAVSDPLPSMHGVHYTTHCVQPMSLPMHRHNVLPSRPLRHSPPDGQLQLTCLTSCSWPCSSWLLYELHKPPEFNPSHPLASQHPRQVRIYWRYPAHNHALRHLYFMRIWPLQCSRWQVIL